MTTLEAIVFTGAVLGVGAILLSLLRNTVSKLVGWLWAHVVERLTLSVTFQNQDQGFALVRDWLAAHPYASKAHRVQMVWDTEANRFTFVPGHGTHYLWYRKRPLIITYGKRDTSNSWDRAIESYSITVFGRDRSRLEAFIDEISCFRKIEEGRLLVYTLSSGNWSWSGKRKRPMDTVYMPEKLKKDVIGYIQQFIKNEAWYNVRGIPWRLGMSFEGPPGTGKTTLATALASQLDRPLYSLNLSTVGSDDALQKAFLTVDRDGIILIEDIDSYGVAQKRNDGDQAEESPTNPSDTPTEAAPPGSLVKVKEKSFGVTLSGLLNAIDGVAASEGRILIMTTNHPEKLDPALVRAGRVDRRVYIGQLGPTEVECMFLCFYPEAASCMPAIRAFAEHRVMTAANWQALFIRYHDSAARLMDDVVEPALALANRGAA